MPRRMGALKRRDQGGLDDRTRERLRSGHDWEFLDGFDRTEEQLARVWDAYRDELMTEWIAEHPLTRPAGWWWFDAPADMRRRIGGVGTPIPNAPNYFGTPGMYDQDYRVEDPPTYEPESHYLRRHGLLTRGER